MDNLQLRIFNFIQEPSRVSCITDDVAGFRTRRRAQRRNAQPVRVRNRVHLAACNPGFRRSVVRMSRPHVRVHRAIRCKASPEAPA